jgi:YD repeat-containing protein
MELRVSTQYTVTDPSWDTSSGPGSDWSDASWGSTDTVQLKSSITTYDNDGNPVRTFTSAGSASGFRLRTVTTYDEQGNPVESVTTSSGAGPIQTRTVSTYDEQGNLVESVTTSSDGASVQGGTSNGQAESPEELIPDC